MPTRTPDQLQATYPQLIEACGPDLARIEKILPFVVDYDERPEVRRVGRAISRTAGIDRWHRGTIGDIYASDCLQGRRALASQSIVLLDEIKEQLVPGEPFLFNETNTGLMRDFSYEGTRSEKPPAFLAGSIDKRTVQFRDRDRIHLGFRGTLVRAETNMPGFSVKENDIRGSELTGDIYDPEDHISNLEEMARNKKWMAFGHDSVVEATRLFSPEERYYAAVALKLAGGEVTPVAQSRRIVREAGSALVRACGGAAAGMFSSNSGQQDVKGLHISRGNVSGTGFVDNSNGAMDLQVRYMRAALEVVGYGADKLEKGMQAYLEGVKGDESQSVALVAAAIRGLQFIGPVVESIFPD